MTEDRDQLDEAHARNETSRKRANDALTEMNRLDEIQSEGRKADDNRRAADDSRREADDSRRGADDVRRAADDVRRQNAYDEKMGEATPSPSPESTPDA